MEFLPEMLLHGFEYGTREFDSVFFQQEYAYPTCWVPRPMELIKHLANTGFQYLENSFLNITAASTATMTVDKLQRIQIYYFFQFYN